MKPMIRLLLGLGAALAGAIAGPARAAGPDPSAMMPAVPSGAVTLWRDLDAGAAGPLSVWVWTPPGYDGRRGKRYPVLYMHDGQNLFDPRLAGYGKAWQIDRAISRMAARGDLRQWIVVGVESPDARLSTLFPEPLFGDLPPAFQQRVTKLFADTDKSIARKGGVYQHFLARVVKPMVDRQFRTRPGIDDTAIMGSSYGGLASLAAMAAYPDVYGAAALLSVTASLAWPVDKPDEAQAVREAAAAFDAMIGRSGMRPARHRIYLDHGTGTDDGTLEPYVRALALVLERRGWAGESALDYRAFAGAAHDEIAWGQRVDIPLAFLDRKDP